MKRAAIVLSVLGGFLWAGCGGGDGQSSENPVSNLRVRAFVTNTFTGNVTIIDAEQDRPTGFTPANIAGGGGMYLSPDKKITIVKSATLGLLTAIDNTKETSVTGNLGMGDIVGDVVMAPDNKTLYASLRNLTNTNAPAGAVRVVDYTAGTITNTIPVRNARGLALDPQGKRLLAFSDSQDVVTVIDVSTATPATTTLTGFSRPVAGFFTADGSKAYILSCGAECGGTQAAVTEVTFASGATRSVNVEGATVGFLNGSTLYVAGAPNGSGGTVQTIDTNAMTASAPVNIGPGTHTSMEFAGNKVWIGARDCGTSRGCLSLFDPSNNQVVVNDPPAGQASNGNLTGMTFIEPRSVMYTIEGGELKVYDLALKEIPTTIDIVGEAGDVQYVPKLQ